MVSPPKRPTRRRSFLVVLLFLFALAVYRFFRGDDPSLYILSADFSDSQNGNGTAYASQEEMKARSERFPSVNERVRHYMQSWYDPPCGDPISYTWRDINNETLLMVHEARQILFMGSKIQVAETFYITQDGLDDCQAQSVRGFCQDIVEYLQPAIDRMQVNEASLPPFIMQVGDGPNMVGMKDAARTQKMFSARLPILKKYRVLKEPRQSKKCRTWSEPIVLLLTSKRHFGSMPSVPTNDVPWSQKRNMAIFRGALTGATIPDEDLEGLTALERCELFPRCRLVLRSHGSELVHAQVTGKTTHKILDQITIANVSLYTSKMSMSLMLQHKALIVLEGNDVASGLKWALYSNSVVMAPKFTKSSWVMEDLLVPWVHFIPLDDSFEDVDEKMQWVLDHDEEAQAIARAGQLWMMDLWYHPQVEADTDAICDEILQRYARHWVYDPEGDWQVD